MLFSNEKRIPSYTKYIVVDSASRDTNYVNAWNYVVNLNYTLKNIISIELVYAYYSGNGVGSNKYIVLDIDEIDSKIESNNNTLLKAFTHLPLDGTNYIDYNSSNFYKSIKYFDKPLSKLARLSISFKNNLGEYYHISEHVLRFEVVCMQLQDNIDLGIDVIGNNSVSIFANIHDLTAFQMDEQLLGLYGEYDFDTCTKRFLEAKKKYKNIDDNKYSECKKAFKNVSRAKFGF